MMKIQDLYRTLGETQDRLGKIDLDIPYSKRPENLNGPLAVLCQELYDARSSLERARKDIKEFLTAAPIELQTGREYEIVYETSEEEPGSVAMSGPGCEIHVKIYNAAGEDVDYDDVPVGTLLLNPDSYETIKKEPNDHITRDFGTTEEWNNIPPQDRLYFRY